MKALHSNSTGTLAARALIEEVYGELRRLAHAEVARGFGSPTLQTTALVHEAWLRLEREGRGSWVSRAQYFVAAATAMRRILVDRARAHGRAKREGSHRRIAWETVEPLVTVSGGLGGTGKDAALLDLDAALADLRAFDAQLACIVELRTFAGLTEAETARTLDLSDRSLRRQWRAARLWLYRRIVARRGDSRPRVSEACDGT